MNASQKKKAAKEFIDGIEKVRKLQAQLAEAEADLQDKFPPIVTAFGGTVEHNIKTVVTDKQGKEYKVEGTRISGEGDLTVNGKKYHLTFFSRSNKGEGRFSHIVKGFTAAKAKECESIAI